MIGGYFESLGAGKNGGCSSAGKIASGAAVLPVGLYLWCGHKSAAVVLIDEILKFRIFTYVFK